MSNTDNSYMVLAHQNWASLMGIQKNRGLFGGRVDHDVEALKRSCSRRSGPRGKSPEVASYEHHPASSLMRTTDVPAHIQTRTRTISVDARHQTHNRDHQAPNAHPLSPTLNRSRSLSGSPSKPSASRAFKSASKRVKCGGFWQRRTVPRNRRWREAGSPSAIHVS